jgi:cell division protein FtsB
MIFILLIVAVYFGYNYFNQEVKMNKLKSENIHYEKKIEKLNKDIDLLHEDLDEVMSEENIEAIAREKLRMISPDEIIYIIEDN